MKGRGDSSSYYVNPFSSYEVDSTEDRYSSSSDLEEQSSSSAYHPYSQMTTSSSTAAPSRVFRHMSSSVSYNNNPFFTYEVDSAEDLYSSGTEEDGDPFKEMAHSRSRSKHYNGSPQGGATVTAPLSSIAFFTSSNSQKSPFPFAAPAASSEIFSSKEQRKEPSRFEFALWNTLDSDSGKLKRNDGEASENHQLENCNCDPSYSSDTDYDRNKDVSCFSHDSGHDGAGLVGTAFATQLGLQGSVKASTAIGRGDVGLGSPHSSPQQSDLTSVCFSHYTIVVNNNNSQLPRSDFSSTYSLGSKTLGRSVPKDKQDSSAPLILGAPIVDTEGLYMEVIPQTLYT